MPHSAYTRAALKAQREARQARLVLLGFGALVPGAALLGYVLSITGVH